MHQGVEFKTFPMNKTHFALLPILNTRNSKKNCEYPLCKGLTQKSRFCGFLRFVRGLKKVETKLKTHVPMLDLDI